jgi:hypothetical protein
MKAEPDPDSVNFRNSKPVKPADDLPADAGNGLAPSGIYHQRPNLELLETNFCCAGSSTIQPEVVR